MITKRASHSTLHRSDAWQQHQNAQAIGNWNQISQNEIFRNQTNQNQSNYERNLYNENQKQQTSSNYKQPQATTSTEGDVVGRNERPSRTTKQL